jgi:hypothetical protein
MHTATAKARVSHAIGATPRVMHESPISRMGPLADSRLTLTERSRWLRSSDVRASLSAVQTEFRNRRALLGVLYLDEVDAVCAPPRSLVTAQRPRDNARALGGLFVGSGLRMQDYSMPSEFAPVFTIARTR